jgi:hypothetical protein
VSDEPVGDERRIENHANNHTGEVSP